jgi:hypothetical protein
MDRVNSRMTEWLGQWCPFAPSQQVSLPNADMDTDSLLNSNQTHSHRNNRAAAAAAFFAAFLFTKAFNLCDTFSVAFFERRKIDTFSRVFASHWKGGNKLDRAGNLN